MRVVTYLTWWKRTVIGNMKGTLSPYLRKGINLRRISSLTVAGLMDLSRSLKQGKGVVEIVRDAGYVLRWRKDGTTKHAKKHEVKAKEIQKLGIITVETTVYMMRHY